MEYSPFLKWAGGKRAILPNLIPLLPNDFSDYYEPFLGGATMLLHLSQIDKTDMNHPRGHRFFTSDISEPLIITYNVVKSNYKDLKDFVELHGESFTYVSREVSKDKFLKARQRFNTLKMKVWTASLEQVKQKLASLSCMSVDEILHQLTLSKKETSSDCVNYSLDVWKELQGKTPSLLTDVLSIAEKVELACLFIYLNKTGFNGMYRENSHGLYNIPPGTYSNPKVFNFTLLEGLSKLWVDTVFEISDYSTVLQKAKEGDFIYLDPPYHETFTSYSKSSFGEKEQKMLKETFDQLDVRGCKVMLSNSATDFIKSLYEKNTQSGKKYSIHDISTKRMINSCSKNRNDVAKEVVVVNY